MENKFVKPESPFLLLTEDVDGNVSYCWWNNEKGLQEDAVERRGSGERIICAIEISAYRDVEIPSGYTVDDFIEEVNSAYDDAKEKGFDSIVLVVQNRHIISMTPKMVFSVMNLIIILRIWILLRKLYLMKRLLGSL